MSPRSLLFSSDQETSRQICQALQQLELSVDVCPEIFAALRTLTSKTFSVIIVDWDEGLEASFLLKTARESRSHHDIFAIVVGKAEARAALEQAGADVVLSKPLRADSIKTLLKTSDAFASRLQNCSQTEEPPVAPTAGPVSWPMRLETKSRPIAVPGWPAPAPATAAQTVAAEAPVHLSFATFDDGLAGSSFFERLFQIARGARLLSWFGAAGMRGLLLRSAAIGVVFFVVGYVFSQPLTEAGAAVATAGLGSWQSLQAWGKHPAEEVQATAPVQEAVSDVPQWQGKSGKIRVMPVRNVQSEQAQLTPQMPDQIAQPASLQEPATEPDPSQAEAGTVSIPDSLGSPFPGLTAARDVAAKANPTLMDALRPVTLPVQLSERLLLEKIVPSYPEKALRVGMRGPVVLQAWIGKDGRIEELKLIRGPLLLGQAAFEAVRNWRYKPYLLNGEAVEAQTQVTVDFKLP